MDIKNGIIRIFVPVLLIGLLWLAMLLRGYDYFMEWKQFMIVLLICLWIISGFIYFVYETGLVKDSLYKT